MAVSFVMLVVLASGSAGQAIRPEVVTYQEQSFDRRGTRSLYGRWQIFRRKGL